MALPAGGREGVLRIDAIALLFLLLLRLACLLARRVSLKGRLAVEDQVVPGAFKIPGAFEIVGGGLVPCKEELWWKVDGTGGLVGRDGLERSRGTSRGTKALGPVRLHWGLESAELKGGAGMKRSK